jgi:hypothetical protein
MLGVGAERAVATEAAPPTQVIFRAQQLVHAMRTAAGHSTPVGSAEEIKAAVRAAVAAEQYTVGPGGVVRGEVMIQGVAHEFTGWMNAAGDMIFSNIYRK